MRLSTHRAVLAGTAHTAHTRAHISGHVDGTPTIVSP